MAPKTKQQQKKQFAQKVEEKNQKEAKKLEKKNQKFDKTQKDKKDKVKTQSIISKQSKKIKKEPIVKPADKKKQVIINPKIENYSEFVKQESAKYEKIKKQTISMINLDKELVKTAVKALLKYHSQKKDPNQLLDTNDDFIYVEIVLSKVPEKHSIRPIQIPLPVPIYTEELGSRMCIFSKDPQREFKDKIQELNIPLIEKVHGVSKIDKKFPTYKEKTKLLYSYDQFFCDYRIYDLLRKPLGKAFYDRKRIPFPIDCSQVPEYLKEKFNNNYEQYLNDLANYTYFQMGNGPCYTVKVGRESMDLKDLVKNIINGAYNTIPHILKQQLKHTSVRSISIKTFNSTSLPIYNQLNPEEIVAFQKN